MEIYIIDWYKTSKILKKILKIQILTGSGIIRKKGGSIYKYY